MTRQWGGRCANLELKAMECLEAHGFTKGMDSCKNLLDDFRECVYQDVQDRRLFAMWDERDRQYKAGQRKEHYAPPPKEETFSK